MHLIHSIDKKFADYIFDNIEKLQNTELLDKKSVISIFFEPSTRTIMSFQLAAGPMQFVNLNTYTSSQSKGETELETINTAIFMQPDFLILRSAFDIYQNIDITQCSAHIINAGCSNISHPTQALTDCYIIKQIIKQNIKQNVDLTSANIVICGDILHSRVAQSNIHLLKSMGFKVGIYSMDKVDKCIQYTSIDDFISQADIIMLTRAQTERHNIKLDEYKKHFSMSKKLLDCTKASCKIMHAGPVNHNIEIDSNIIYHAKSLISTQVAVGVKIRRAVYNAMLTI